MRERKRAQIGDADAEGNWVYSCEAEIWYKSYGIARDIEQKKKGGGRMESADKTTYRKLRKLLFIGGAALTVLFFILSGITFLRYVREVSAENREERVYRDAVALYERGSTEYLEDLLKESRDKFQEIKEHEGSEEYIGKIDTELSQIDAYNKAMDLKNTGKIDEAFTAFEPLQGYRDVDNILSSMVKDGIFGNVEKYMAQGEYEPARQELRRVPAYLKDYYEEAQRKIIAVDAAEKAAILKAKYDQAVAHFNAGEYIQAQDILVSIASEMDVSEYLSKIGQHYYDDAKELYFAGEYLKCYEKIINSRIDNAAYWADVQRALDLKASSVSAYKAMVKEKALQIYEAEGYNAMEEFVKSSICIIYSDVTANTFLSKYTPVYLDTVAPTKEETYASGWEAFMSQYEMIHFSSGKVDGFGQTHEHVLMGQRAKSTWHLGKEYSRISGCMFVFKDCETVEGQPVMLWITDGDGNTLVRKDLYSGEANYEFTADVSECEDIVIYFDAKAANIFAINDGNYGGVGEIMLMKQVSS